MNGEGTAVVNIGRRTTGTYDIEIKNVEIHDLKVKPRENFWASIFKEGHGAVLHGFFFETLDWNYGNILDEDTGIYIGDAYTDLLFAANRFLRQDFCPLGSLFYLDGLIPWVFTDDYNLLNGEIDITFLCGSDIQSHSAKGAIGIRIDGTQNFNVHDVHIHDLINWGDLGSDKCGQYERIVFETGVDVDKDIQYGYTGDNVHGILTNYATGSIKNVKVENLKSWHGSTHGIAIYKGSEVQFAGDITIDELVAGQKLHHDEVNRLQLPNAPPFVCSIFLGPNSDHINTPEITPNTDLLEDFTVNVGDEIYGYTFCDENDRIGDMARPTNYVQGHKKSSSDIETFNLYSNGSVINKYFNPYHAIISGMILSIFVFIALYMKKLICSDSYNGNKINSAEIDRLSSFKTSSYGSVTKEKVHMPIC